MVPAAIDTFFLRDTGHGGSAKQAKTVAKRLAEFVSDAGSSIDIAIYDFRLSNSLARTVVQPLIDAARRGVRVRIAYDAAKPAKATPRTFALMAADPAPIGTAQWVATAFGNSDVQLRPITAPSGQLMHSKFIVRDGDATGEGQHSTGALSAVWTGSTNFTDDAWTLQENNIIVVHSARVAAAYQADFEQLWVAGSIKETGRDVTGSSTVDGAAVGWDFAPGDGTAMDGALATAVSSAARRIVVASMVLTSHTVLSSLVTAIDNGVRVAGLYDQGQMAQIEREWSSNPSSATVLTNWTTVKKRLSGKKSTPYKASSPHDFMHNKVLVADDQLLTGSYNFSANAEKNAENQLHIASERELVSAYADYLAVIAKTYR